MDRQVIEYLKRQSIKVIEEDIEQKLDTWRDWYKGKVETFHNYKVYQGKKRINLDRKSLGMAARAAQRWADLLINEKVEININDEYTEERLHELLHAVNFYVRGNNLIETAFAIGGGFFIQYWDGEKTAQKYVMQDYFYPISYDSGRLTEAAFSTRKHIDGKEYVYLETHLLDDKGEYVIDNTLLKNEGGALEEVSAAFYEEHQIIPKWETHSKSPLFQMVRPNVANRDSFNSPYGQSIYSGAIDILKVIDTIYDSYYKEFLLGKKRIFVKDGVSNINFDKTTGETIEVFDPNDEVFYRLPGDENDPPLTESNPALRTGDHNLALQTQLDCLSQAVGFGSNGFKWEAGAVSTATQIISENSEMFRTLKKHEALIRDAIINMVKGLLYIEATFGADKKLKLDADITVNFDDSIIEDTAEIKRQAMLEYNAGLIDAIEYYMTVYKMTEDQALEWRQRMLDRAEPIEEEPEPEDPEDDDTPPPQKAPKKEDKKETKKEDKKPAKKKDEE